MNYKIILLLLLLINYTQAQNIIKSPKEFWAYEPGEQFAFHHEVVAYFQHVADQSDYVDLIQFGTTHEGRPQILAVISSPENLKSIEQIKKNNLIAAGFETGSIQGKHIPIVWLGYSIHGNESAGTTAASPTLYALASLARPEMKDWLDNLVVLIDPSHNPDGYSRYVNWYKQTQNLRLNPARNTWEHTEPWPGGRYNHYLFDLNRDWTWQTQQESRNRIKIYQQWMPHVLVDLHEMGVNSPYHFAPASRPMHEDITPWQKEFQKHTGENNSRYFDKEGWLYFTKEVYDLFYPSYGDTWPTFNGAIGFTYEQGGSGRAGLGVVIENQDTLTLKDRMLHHFTSSIATVETAFKHREKLISEFKKYFQDSRSNPPGMYKTYILKAQKESDNHKLRAFTSLMDKIGIQYGFASGSGASLKGYAYRENADKSFKIEEGDIVVSAYQNKSKLLKVLMEPHPVLEDSLTYDLTAWALPFAYGLEAYALKERINPSDQEVKWETPAFENIENAYAYLCAWEDLRHAAFLGDLLQQNIKVRHNLEDIKIADQEFRRGTLIITRADNPTFEKKLGQIIRETALKHQVKITPILSGFAQNGPDLGSSKIETISKPKVALLAGEDISPTAFGELWYFFEQDLGYPIDILPLSSLRRQDLHQYQVILLPSGNYDTYSFNLMDYASQGGKLIAIGSAVETFASNTQTKLGQLFKKQEDESQKKKDEIKPDDEKHLKKYQDQERKELEDQVAGAIYKIYLDDTHPLAFGKKDYFYIVKDNNQVYPYLTEKGWNVGYFKKDSHTAGFIGNKLKTKLINTLAIGQENYGSGALIYFMDSPVFRSFWHDGKLILANAVFFW